LKRGSKRRQAYIVIFVVSLFLGVVFILTLRLSTHLAVTTTLPSSPNNNLIIDTTARWENVLSGGIVDAEAFGIAGHTLSSVPNMNLWRVVSSGGAVVSLHHTVSSNTAPGAQHIGNGKGALVQLLPRGAIVIGKVSNISTLTLRAPTPCDGAPQSYTIMVHYPVRGWLQSGSCVSNGVYEHVVELKEDETRVIRRKTEVPEPSGRYCDPSTIRLGVDLAGGDMGALPQHVASPAECCARCSQVVTCGGWTITDNKDCWLKYTGKFKTKVLADKKNKNKIISGILPPCNDTAVASKYADIRFPPCCSIAPRPTSTNTADSSASKRSSLPLFVEDDSTIYISSSRLDWSTQFPVGTGSMGTFS
jgi:hypothetical protein